MSTTPHPAPSRSRTAARLGEGLKLLALMAGLLMARSSLADHYYVPSESMLPTLAVGDRLLVNKLAYDLRLPFSSVRLWSRGGPERGDVAVLSSPDSDVTLVKRVVAVPGDRITVQDGRLRLNDQEVEIAAIGPALIELLPDRPHSLRLTDGGGPDYGPVEIPADRYLVMGDNRGNSHDGRSFGLVPRGRFLGRVEGLYVHDGRIGWHAAP